MNVVITGAARGIGLGFVKHYLAQGAHVWAGYRSDKGGLAEIDNTNLTCVQWDVTKVKSSPDLVEADFPDDIHLLINNAGIYGPKKDAGQGLDSVTADTMLAVFDVDCVGPLRVVQSLLPRLINGKATIANVSSKMGSSSDNTSGGCYAYRAAKAGLVIVSKSMAVDLAVNGCCVLTLHPGWVRTDMTSQSGLIDVDTSVAGMANVITHSGRYQPGEFVAFDGQVIPY